MKYGIGAKRTLVGAAAAGLMPLAMAAVAMAQDKAPSGRYTMSPVDGGFVRLDTRNGSMAICKKDENDTAKWSCQPMEDTAKAQAEELASLRKENARLKGTVARLEDRLALLEKPAEGPKKPGAGLSLPSEKQVDEALNYFENLIKKFKERLRRLEKPPAGTEPGERQL